MGCREVSLSEKHHRCDRMERQSDMGKAYRKSTLGRGKHTGEQTVGQKGRWGEIQQEHQNSGYRSEWAGLARAFGGSIRHRGCKQESVLIKLCPDAWLWLVGRE